MTDFVRDNAWSIATSVVLVVAAAAVGNYKIEQNSTKIQRNEIALEGKAAKTQQEFLQKVLGDIQLDVAQLCAAQFGAEKCYTSRRR